MPLLLGEGKLTTWSHGRFLSFSYLHHFKAQRMRWLGTMDQRQKGQSVQFLQREIPPRADYLERTWGGGEAATCADERAFRESRKRQKANPARFLTPEAGTCWMTSPKRADIITFSRTLSSLSLPEALIQDPRASWESSSQGGQPCAWKLKTLSRSVRLCSSSISVLCKSQAPGSPQSPPAKTPGPGLTYHDPLSLSLSAEDPPLCTDPSETPTGGSHFPPDSAGWT